jgi:hypothetical protein
MASHGKNYQESLSHVDRETLYGLCEAIDIVKGLAKA